VNTGKFHALIISSFVGFVFFFGGQASIVKNAKNEKKAKQSQKIKKQKNLVFRLQKPLKTFGDKLKVAS
jgi:hypothetical protein